MFRLRPGIGPVNKFWALRYTIPTALEILIVSTIQSTVTLTVSMLFARTCCSDFIPRSWLLDIGLADANHKDSEQSRNHLAVELFQNTPKLKSGCSPKP